ncbi:restriction endonuclease subunit S [Xanthomonas campestris pv. fici]|uniref:restriction endonuclease subunit S n=1 Tax=Xanthomonas euvesicatoria TaxID=456327 RepID=UPI003556F4B0
MAKFQRFKRHSSERRNIPHSQASLFRPSLKALRIPTPTLAEQRSIAATLGVLDDKIEQNHRTSQTLEELARATFKAWFVDFEPVKAKAAGQSSFPGMLADTFAALPDRFADSPLGLVPEGWEATALSATCQIVSGGTPKRSISDYWGGDIPWYSVKDAPEDGMPWVQITGETITQAGLQGSAATLVPVGATIISARGTVGRLALAAQPMAFNQSCYGLLPIDGKSFCHLHLLLQHVVRKLKKMTHGSVFETITKQTFDSVSVIQALAPVIESFEQIVAPLFALQLGKL